MPKRGLRKVGRPYAENPLPIYEKIAALTVDQDGDVIPAEDVKCVIDAIVAAAVNELVEERDFSVPGLGVFKSQPCVIKNNAFGRKEFPNGGHVRAIRFSVSDGVKHQIRKRRREDREQRERMAMKVLHRKPKPAQ